MDDDDYEEVEAQEWYFHSDLIRPRPVERPRNATWLGAWVTLETGQRDFIGVLMSSWDDACTLLAETRLRCNVYRWRIDQFEDNNSVKTKSNVGGYS